MIERDDVEELLRVAQKRHAQALEQELDRRVSRLWRAPERRKLLMRPALALASIAVLFLGAWLYDLSQSGGTSSIIQLRDARYERPQLVLRGPGDPVRLTQQIAGVPEQAPTEHLRLVEPGLPTGIFQFEETRKYTAIVEDQAGNWFLAEESGRIVKRVIHGEALQREEVILEGLDRPNGLAFDRDGSLLVLEGGRGRIVRVEPIGGEITSGSPVSVLGEGFGKLSAPAEEEIESLKDVAARREERLALELAPKERMEPVYLAVSASGDIFVGGQLDGEAVVYKIGRKSFKWWKFYCLYRC